MNINGYTIPSRYERPSVLSKTALVMYFINNGQYYDPYEIKGVSIFAANNNYAPSSVVDSDGLISSEVTQQILMHMGNGDVTQTTNSAFDVSNYNADPTASGVYKLDTGKYVCILDSPNVVPSGVLNIFDSTSVVSNTVSATGDYIDVWTVKRVAGSNYATFINNFTLTADRFIGVTEPLLFKVSSKLDNIYIPLGSKVDLKFSNEFTIENANIGREITNLFRQSVISDPQLLLYKLNDDRNLPARVEVSGYSQTSGSLDITSENTIVFNFDTEALKTHPELLAGNFGPLTGAYSARLKFNVLNQTIVTNDMSFIVR